MADAALLLTATVHPLAGLPALARTDPAQRLDDYRQTLQGYLGLLERGVFKAIVLAENSGADLSVLRRLVAERGCEDRVEFLVFQGLDFDPGKGRGYGEFRMVDHAMAHARMLQPEHASQVWKCTGRYRVRNLETLVKRAEPFDLQVHCRNRPQPWCELYLLAWSQAGYQGLIRGIYPRLANDVRPPGHTTEEILFREIVDAGGPGLRVVPRFKRHPIVEGVRGWNNARFEHRWASPKTWVRSAAARWLPSLWL